MPPGRFRLSVPFALVIVLAATAPAQARPRVLAPPGNSAINQYVEVIPTASGGRPAGSIHAGGGSPGAGAAGPAGGLPARTAKALARRGPDGAAVASLVRATSPPAGGSTKPATTAAPAASSAPGTVLKTLAGPSPSGGLGLLLPILLGGGFLGAGLLALRRRRAS